MSERVRALGVALDALTVEQLTAAVAALVEQRARNALVANHNLHSVYLYHTDEKFRRLYDGARLIHIDGMPLVWAARLGGAAVGPRQRAAYLDWTPALMRLARERGWKVFFLGGVPGVAESARERLLAREPGLKLEVHHGYFDATPGAPGQQEVLRRINECRPDLLLVGMGMPRQEHWIADSLGSLEAGVILNCGAAFDYIGGAAWAPPRWAGALGIEWLLRLAAEPRRLARRYLIEPWQLAWLLLRRRLGR